MVNETTTSKQFCSTNQGDSKIDLSFNPRQTNEVGDMKMDLNTDALFDHAPKGLPPGWITETRFRKSKSMIKKDMLYIDPEGKYALRSLKDVFRYITAGDISKCASRPIERKGKLISNSEPQSWTSTTRLNQPVDAVQRCLFSEQTPDMHVCGEISESRVTAQLPDQDENTAGPANGELRSGNEGLSAKKIELDIYSKVQPQAKNQKRSQQVGSRQSRTNKGIAVPVRASKRLAALRTDDLTESGVCDGFGDAVSMPNSQLNPNSFQDIAHWSTTSVGILDVKHPSELPSHGSVEAPDITSGGSESKLLQSVNNDLSAENGDLSEEMKLKITSNGHSQPANPSGGYKLRSRKRFAKATTVPVRASKRLAALVSGTPENSEVVDHSGYDTSMPKNGLEANLTKSSDFMAIDSRSITELSHQEPEEMPEIFSSVSESFKYIQPETDDPLVGEVKLIAETGSMDGIKLVEETTLGLTDTEQIQSKKLKRGHPQDSWNDKSMEQVAMATAVSKEVAKGLERSKVEVPCVHEMRRNNPLEKHSSNDHKLKCPAAYERFEEPSETLIPVAADRFKEQLESTVTIVRLEKELTAPMATERYEESSKFSLPIESFEKQKIELAANCQHEEEPERKEPGNQEVREDADLEKKLDSHESGSQFISPFGNSWLDPCIEFAFKTLTGDIPEDYFQQQHQPDLTSKPNDYPAPCTNVKAGTLDQSEPRSHLGLWDDRLWSFEHDDRSGYMQNDPQSTKKNG